MRSSNVHAWRASILSILVLLGGAGAIHAQCAGGTYVLDLEHGTAMPSSPPGSLTVLSLAPTQNPSCSTGYAAVVRVNMQGCSEAILVVEWDKPIAWTVPIADSPTSDGYGGDAGTTLNNAELWINQQILWVATNRTNGINDNELAQENLDLNDGAMKFEVSNQRVAWGRPYHVLETPNLKKLYAFPDTSNPAEGYYLYLGLNRVVGNFPTRQGCGALRAMITVE
jgi:hypothetical protein